MSHTCDPSIRETGRQRLPWVCSIPGLHSEILSQDPHPYQKKLSWVSYALCIKIKPERGISDRPGHRGTNGELNTDGKLSNMLTIYPRWNWGGHKAPGSLTPSLKQILGFLYLIVTFAMLVSRSTGAEYGVMVRSVYESSQAQMGMEEINVLGQVANSKTYCISSSQWS